MLIRVLIFDSLEYVERLPGQTRPHYLRKHIPCHALEISTDVVAGRKISNRVGSCSVLIVHVAEEAVAESPASKQSAILSSQSPAQTGLHIGLISVLSPQYSTVSSSVSLSQASPPAKPQGLLLVANMPAVRTRHLLFRA